MTTMALALQNALVAKTGASSFSSLGGDIVQAIRTGVAKAAAHERKEGRDKYIARLMQKARGKGDTAIEATFKLQKMGVI